MKQVELRKKKNREAQKTMLEGRKGKEAGAKNPWEKVLENVELKESSYLGTKDVARMRQVMIGRKNDIKQGIAQIS